ncbi:hypothetical protein MMB17_07415 [Methylobacterium organophilum]|uniref:hypothetical protein n=1 Tax=Methylobacterium organophilum TaxID=410 RepID=UPI001F143C1D|nr:hypothetical protein [Methylobacterium organophilum]UMY19118.1 hypothetical protein MMB17_07415 [Methylobacterium organophilum]
MISPADRLADTSPEPDPVLSGEEAEALAETAPTEEALAAIAAAEAREVRRAMMQRLQL